MVEANKIVKTPTLEGHGQARDGLARGEDGELVLDASDAIDEAATVCRDTHSRGDICQQQARTSQHTLTRNVRRRERMSVRTVENTSGYE